MCGREHTEGHLWTAYKHNPTTFAFNLEKAETWTPEFMDDDISALPDDWIWVFELFSIISSDRESSMVIPLEAMRELKTQ